MAEFEGLTKAKAEEILGMSVVSVTVNETGQLVCTRGNGTSFIGGDFQAAMEALAEERVDEMLPTAVSDAVAGTVVHKGDVSGAITMPEFTSANLVNALVTLTATGNLTFNVTALPGAPKANTQFAMRITQDGTGGRTLALTGFKRSGGYLVLSTGANDVDVLMFFYDGAAWYAGAMGLDMS